jgi:hypothetical protein
VSINLNNEIMGRREDKKKDQPLKKKKNVAAKCRTN